MLDSTCNAIGNFIATALLYPTYTIFMATAFLPFFLLDPYIRTFVSGCQPHSCHRHFIDPRPIYRTIHLWTAFHICLTALFGRFSADFNVLCQRRILHSFASNVVSGERFRALPHHSTSWIVSSPNIWNFRSFVNAWFCPSTTKALFRNESHWCPCRIRRGLLFSVPQSYCGPDR